jgi:hypothetical protein
MTQPPHAIFPRFAALWSMNCCSNKAQHCHFGISSAKVTLNTNLTLRRVGVASAHDQGNSRAAATITPNHHSTQNRTKYQQNVNFCCQLTQNMFIFLHSLLQCSAFFMNNERNCMKYLAIALLAATSVSAQAQTFDTDNLSAFINLGSTTQEAKNFTNAKDSTTSIDIGLQYQFDSHWSMGVSYADFGEVTLEKVKNQQISVQNIRLARDLSINSKLNSFNVFGQLQTDAEVGYLTFGMRLGLSRWSHDLPQIYTITSAPAAARDIIGQTFTESSNATGIDIYGGLFAEYLMSETITLGLYVTNLRFDSTMEWAVQSQKEQEFNALTYSIGLKYNF